MTIGVSPRGLTRQARQASKQADRAVREASPWIKGLGRFGHLSIGLVYGTIGVLAAQAALGQGGDTTDSHGALAWLLQASPFGRAILVALSVGLAGYALWRLVQAIRDTESKGTDLKGIGYRLVYAFIGVTYGGLALSAFRLAQNQGEPSGGGDATARDWTAWLLSQPFGQILVAAVGLVVLGVSVVQFYLAFTDGCCDRVQMSRMNETQQRLVRWSGQVGFSARGIAFAIIGVLLIVAAIRSRPDEARGLGGALATLAQQPFGPWLLGAVAVGFVAYGAFMMVQARYRRFIVR